MKFKHKNLHNDIIDWNMDKFDKETNESHEGKTDSSGESDLLKFFSIRLGTFLDETVRILHELFAWLNVLVDVIHFNRIIQYISKIK
jgi:hypothetical protein